MQQDSLTRIQQMESRHLNMFCDYILKNFGIFTEETKKNILASKLKTLMRKAGIEDDLQYYHIVVSPPITEHHRSIKNEFVDTVTIHKTNFFRENRHFDYIKKIIREIISNSEGLKLTGELRVWCSACSTGEEPYTLAMLFKEILPVGMRAKILATDISPESIRKAMTGVYKLGNEDHLPPGYLSRYFTTAGDKYAINDEIKKYVTFRLFNLIEDFPFKNPFDIIFCRNVMIYFNTKVQEKLINKFYDVTSNNGLLFIGHSESLIQLKNKYIYTEPTIYKKC